MKDACRGGAWCSSEIAEMVAQVIGMAVAGLAQMGALVIATIGVVVLATAQNAKPWPTFGDTAFRAQRDAMEHAQQTLKKAGCAGPWRALTHLLTAWEKRDATQLPSAPGFGWTCVCVRPCHLGAGAVCCSKGDAAEALLRLEIAAEVPTPQSTSLPAACCNCNC